MRALDFFAGDGSILSKDLLPGASITAWEIDAEPLARYVLPAEEKRCGDSFTFAREPQYLKRFDYILIDNPTGPFGPVPYHCEHFEALPACVPMLADESAVTFNIVTSISEFMGGRVRESLGYLRKAARMALNGKVGLWAERRRWFYEDGRPCPEFYVGFFKQRGFTVKQFTELKRMAGLYLLTIRVKREGLI